MTLLPCLEPHLGWLEWLGWLGYLALSLSIRCLIFQEARLDLFSRYECSEKERRLQGLLRLKLSGSTASPLLHSIDQSKSKAQPSLNKSANRLLLFREGAARILWPYLIYHNSPSAHNYLHSFCMTNILTTLRDLQKSNPLMASGLKSCDLHLVCSLMKPFRYKFSWTRDWWIKKQVMCPLHTQHKMVRQG